jgi:hypothetical protein
MSNNDFNCIEELKASARFLLFSGSASLLAASSYANSHSEIASGFFKEFSPLVTMLHDTTESWRSVINGGAIVLMLLVTIWGIYDSDTLRPNNH